ncbi:MAG TPA: hypothetical protein VHP99_18730, partial [Pyrinomonadaceae bacterium]|nr:hypothetical protein [Pyrinomonadaceae bacterium]
MTITKTKTRRNKILRGSELAALCLVLALIAGGWLSHFIPGVTSGAASHLTSRSERVTVHLAERQTSYLTLSGDAAAVPTDYTSGTGVKELAEGTVAHGLASADFDEDGVPDLVGGYTGSSAAGVVTLQRGNVDAIYPNSPEARERRARGEFTDAPFRSAAGAFMVPEAADFVGAGDFDADGHWDVVAARRGGNALYFLRGDGRGNLARAERIQLPGALTVLVTGEMNRRDGLTDIVVGITNDAGAAALVFESPAGALRSQPETLALPAAASDLALGALDTDPAANDLAIAAGNELLIVHGRDRRLSVNEPSGAAVPEASVSRSVFESAVASIAIGDFAGDFRQELAVLTADGSVRVFNETEKKTNNANASALRSSETMMLALGVAEAGTSPRRLLAAKVSALPKDDLLVFGGANEVQIVTTNAPDVFDGSGKLTTGSARLSVAASLTSESEVAAVLPMRLNADALQDLVMATKKGIAPSVVHTEAAATFVVNVEGNTNDKNPGDGLCADTADKCSFNAALQEANANPGADTIKFNIPGGGVHTVTHGSQQYFNEAVTIDGTTQPDGRIEIVANGDFPVVFFGGNSVLRGVAVYGSDVAIILASNGNIVEGNYVGFRSDGTKPVGFGSAGSGITFRGGISGSLRGDNNLIGGTTAQARNVISNCSQALQLADSVANVFRGNYIGTNVAGTAALLNATPFVSFGGDVTIGGTTSGAGNLISGNGSTATLLIQNSTALIQGNLIGTTADGSQPLQNNGIGIDVSSGGKVVTIGGTTPAARNVIAANATGIFIRQDDTPGSNEIVQGNFIGTNAAGTGALPNLTSGIFTGGATHVTIGGTATGAGNLISGNGEDGISVSGGSNNTPSLAIIQGNLIGTDVTGGVALPNTRDGIGMPSSAGTVIGGPSAAARNIISGNHVNGIRLDAGANSNRIEGNYIGLNRFGTGALGNTGNGVFISYGFTLGNTIGGTAGGAGNNIAFNGGAGVASNNGNPVLAAVVANSIHDNVGLGIDLSNDGVTKNTPGANSNYPVITSVQSSNTSTTIQGTLQNGNFTAGITYTLQFFSNSKLDPSGYGEGETYIGQTTLTTDGTTSAHPFSVTVPAVPPGRFITAVASGKDQFNQAGFEYLSEFSFAAKVTGITTPQNTPLRLNVVTPMVGGDNGGSTLTIIGEGISQNATVRLRRVGQSDIVGASVIVSPDGSSLIARFNLTGQAQGAWDIVVTNADATTTILPGAFTIEAGRAPVIWADLLGRTAIRRSQAIRYTAVCGNRGNADAYGVPLFVTGIPKGAKVTLGFDLLPITLTGPQLQNFSPSQIPAVIQTSSEQMIPLIIPVIPVNTVRSLTFTIEVPATQSNFSLKVFAMDPLLEVVNSSAQNSSRQTILADAPDGTPIQLAASQNGA